MKRVLIFTKKTKLGEWQISTDEETFAVSAVTYGFEYFLSFSGESEFERFTDKNVYEHIRAVAEHRTGLAIWDFDSVYVSDYAKDWNLHIDKKFKMNLVADYLRMNHSTASMRGMVDYFEHKHGYMIERMEIRDLLRELMMTGQIEKIPSMAMAPAEMKSLERMAKVWLNESTT